MCRAWPVGVSTPSSASGRKAGASSGCSYPERKRGSCLSAAIPCLPGGQARKAETCSPQSTRSPLFQDGLKQHNSPLKKIQIPKTSCSRAILCAEVFYIWKLGAEWSISAFKQNEQVLKYLSSKLWKEKVNNEKTWKKFKGTAEDSKLQV